MKPERWTLIQSLFHDAIDAPATERRARLTKKCGDDEELMNEVLTLLESDAMGDQLLDRDMAVIAGEVFSTDAAGADAQRDFGSYRLKHRIGEGGMGTVYLAERKDLGSTVAIKVLRDAWASPARRERFLSEQKLHAKLNHPSIARLYDAATLPDGTPYFVMEYVDGVSLVAHCAKNACSTGEKLSLFRAVCTAVQYAHEHALIHRDLKPSNILVKTDGTVRLLDFGIAKELERIDLPAEQTQTGLRMLTPAYAAPEQIRGEQVGIYTDVYALGVILYELLTSRHPFDLANRSPREVEQIVCEQELRRPSTAVDGRGSLRDKAAWADLDVLVSTAMHRDPARRYRSVEALVRDLDHYTKNEPLEARPDSPGYRARKFVRRNGRAVATFGVTFTLVMAVIVFFTVRLANAHDAALAEAARTQRIQEFMKRLFEGGDEASGPSEDLRVITLIDRGAQEARTFDRDPAVQADLYETLGTLYLALGKFDRADSLLRSSLTTREALFGAESRQAAESLVALGLSLQEQAQLDEGEALIRRAVDIIKHRLPSGQAQLAKALSALGGVLTSRGAYQDAIGTLQEAVQILSTHAGEPRVLGETLSSLANAHFYLGHYPESRSLNERVLEIERQSVGERHPSVADTLINLGAIHFDQGRYADAEQLDRQAVEITEAWFGKEHYKTASALTILGRSLNYLGRYGDATDVLQRALAINERTYGRVHPSVASTLNDLGVIARQRGELDDAEAYFQRMLDIERAIYKDKHNLIGTAMSNLGSVYLARKQYDKAEPLIRDAVAMFAQTLSPRHMNTAVARVRLGRCLVGEKRYGEAEIESRAGYEILVAQTSPSVWLKQAREDLVEEYEALNDRAKADKYRSELAP